MDWVTCSDLAVGWVMCSDLAVDWVTCSDLVAGSDLLMWIDLAASFDLPLELNLTMNSVREKIPLASLGTAMDLVPMTSLHCPDKLLDVASSLQEDK